MAYEARGSQDRQQAVVEALNFAANTCNSMSYHIREFMMQGYAKEQIKCDFGARMAGGIALDFLPYVEADTALSFAQRQIIKRGATTSAKFAAGLTQMCRSLLAVQ